MVNNRFKIRAIIGGLFFVLLLIGTGAAYFLTQQNQDIRQQASGGCAVGDPYCSCDINGSNCTEVNPDDVRTIVDQGGDLNSKGILATSYTGDRASSQGGCSGVWQNDFCYMPGDELAGGYVVVENGRYNYPYFEQKQRYESAEYGGETVNQNLGSVEQLGKDCDGQGLAINGTCYSYGSNVNGFLVMDARTTGCDNSTGDYCYAHLEKIDTNYDDWQKAVASYESNGDYAALEKLYEETYGLSFEVGGLFDPNAANAKQLRAQALITALTNADVLKGKAAEQNAALDELSKANGGLDEGQQSLYEFNQQLIAAENLDKRYQALDQLTKSTGQQTAINQAISSMYGQLVAAENDEELKKITADRFEEIFGYDPIEKYGSTKGVLEVFGLNPAQLEADRKSYQQTQVAMQPTGSQLNPGISAPINSAQQSDEQKKQTQAINAINDYLSGEISESSLAKAAGIPTQANLSPEALLSILFQRVGYDSSQSTEMAKDALSDKQTSSVITGYLSGSKTKLDLAREAGLPEAVAYSMTTESILATLYRKLGDSPIIASEKASEVFAIKSDIIKEGVLTDAYQKNPNSTTAIRNLYTYYTGDTGDPGKPGGTLNNLLTVDQMTTELAKRNSNIALQAYLNTGNLNYLKENYVVGKSVVEITNSGVLDNELSLLQGIFGEVRGKNIYNSDVLPVSLNNALNNFAQNPDQLEAVCSRALGSACNLSETNATEKLDKMYRLAYEDRNSDDDPSNDINIAELSATQAQQLFRESKKEAKESWIDAAFANFAMANASKAGFTQAGQESIETSREYQSEAQAQYAVAINNTKIFDSQDTFTYASYANIRQNLPDYLYGGIMGDAFMNDDIFNRTYDLQGSGENGLRLSWWDANYMAFNQVRTQVFGQTKLATNIATNYAMVMQQGYAGPANTRVADVAFQATQNLGGNYQSAFGLDYQAANNGYYLGKDLTNAGATLADWSATAATYAGLAMQGGDYSYSPSFLPQEMRDIAVNTGNQVGDSIRQNSAENYAETYKIDEDAYIAFNTDDEIVRSRSELNWETAKKVVAPTVAIVALPVAVASGAGIGIVTGVASGAWTFYQGAGQKAQAFELQRTVISENADDGDNVAALSIAQTFMANDESLSYDQAYDKAIGQVEEQIQSTNKQANIMLASSAVAFINSGSGIIQGFTGAQSALTTSLSWAGRGGGVALSGVTAASAAQQVVSVNEQLKNFEQTVAEQNLSAAEAEKLHKDLVSQRIFSSLSTGVAVIGGVGTSLNALTEVGAVTRSFGTAADMVIDSLSLPLGSAVDLQNISQSCFTSNYAADDTACRDAWVGLALSVTQDVTQIRNSSQARQNFNTSQSPDYIRSTNQAQVEDYMQRISEVNRQIDMSDLLNKPSGSMTPTDIARLTELSSLRAELSGKVLGLNPTVKIPELAKPVVVADVQRLLDSAESNRLFLDDSANKLQNVDIDLAVKSLEQSEAQAEVVRLGTEINDLDNLARQNLNLDASAEDVESYRETRQGYVDELIARVNDPVLRSADLNDNQRLIAAVQAQEGEIIKNYDAARKQAQSQAEELEKLNLPPPEDVPERKTGLAALLPGARKSNQAIDAYEQARVATVELERLQTEITRIGDEVVDLARNNASDADSRSRLSELRDLNRQYEAAKKTAYDAVDKASSSLAAVAPETARQTIGDTDQDPGVQQPRTIAKVFTGLVGGTVDRIRSIPEIITAGSTRRQVAALKDLAQSLGTKNSDTVYQISLRQVEIDRLRGLDPVGNGAEIIKLEGAINDLLRDSQSSLRGGNALIEVDRTKKFTTFQVTKVGKDAGLNNNQLKILNDSLKSFETFRRTLQSPQEIDDYGPFKIYSGTGSFKDQDVFLLAEIEAFGAGRRGTVFGALPGMGKTDVVMPFNVLLKQRLTDKPQFVVFPEAKLMKPWVIDDNYTPNKVFIDHVESEFGKGSVLIIKPNENVDPAAIARAKFIITIKDVAFDLQNTSTPTGLALRDKWGNSFVHADEVDWTFNPNESYKQSGRQVALTDKPEYQTYLNAQKVVLGIDENGQNSGRGLSSLRALVAEAEAKRSIPTGIAKTEDGNAGKFSDASLERRVLSEWLDTWGGQSRIADLDMTGDLDVARQKIDEYLTNASAEDLQQLRSQRAMINETVSFLSKVPNEDYGLTTRTEIVGGTEEIIGSISPRERGKLTGRSYSAVAEQLLYNSVGARVLGVTDQVDLSRITVGEGGSDINYALLMLESQGFSLYTGTPETVAKLYKMAYGIDLQVFSDSAVDDSITRFKNPPDGRKSGVFTTVEGQITARLDDGENQVFINMAAGLRSNEVARNDLVQKINDVVAQKQVDDPDYKNPYKKFFLIGANGELTEYRIVGANLQKVGDFADTNSLNAKTAQLDESGEQYVKFYEFGAHVGVDTKTNVEISRAVGICNGCDETTFGQGINRVRVDVKVNSSDNTASVKHAPMDVIWLDAPNRNPSIDDFASAIKAKQVINEALAEVSFKETLLRNSVDGTFSDLIKLAESGKKGFLGIGGYKANEELVVQLELARQKWKESSEMNYLSSSDNMTAQVKLEKTAAQVRAVYAELDRLLAGSGAPADLLAQRADGAIGDQPTRLAFVSDDNYKVLGEAPSYKQIVELINNSSKHLDEVNIAFTDRRSPAEVVGQEVASVTQRNEAGVEQTRQTQTQTQAQTNRAQANNVVNTTQAVRDLNDVASNPLKLVTNWNRMVRGARSLASLPASILGSIRAQDAEQQEYVVKQEELAALELSLTQASDQENINISQQIERVKAELDGFKAFTKITAQLDAWWLNITAEEEPTANQGPVAQRNTEQAQEETRQAEEETRQAEEETRQAEEEALHGQERVEEPVEQEQQESPEETQTQTNRAQANNVVNTTQAVRDLNDVASNPLKLVTNWNRMVRGIKTLPSLPASILRSIKGSSLFQDAEKQQYTDKQAELIALKLKLMMASNQEKMNISQQIKRVEADLRGFKLSIKVVAKLEEFWFGVQFPEEVSQQTQEQDTLVDQEYLNNLTLTEYVITGSVAEIKFVEGDDRFAVKFASTSDVERETNILRAFNDVEGGELLVKYYGTMQSIASPNYVMERIDGRTIDRIVISDITLTDEAIELALSRYKSLLSLGFDNLDIGLTTGRNIFVTNKGEVRIIDPIGSVRETPLSLEDQQGRLDFFEKVLRQQQIAQQNYRTSANLLNEDQVKYQVLKDQFAALGTTVSAINNEEDYLVQQKRLEKVLAEIQALELGSNLDFLTVNDDEAGVPLVRVDTTKNLSTFRTEAQREITRLNQERVEAAARAAEEAASREIAEAEARDAQERAEAQERTRVEAERLAAEAESREAQERVDLERLAAEAEAREAQERADLERLAAEAESEKAAAEKFLSEIGQQEFPSSPLSARSAPVVLALPRSGVLSPVTALVDTSLSIYDQVQAWQQLQDVPLTNAQRVARLSNQILMSFLHASQNQVLDVFPIDSQRELLAIQEQYGLPENPITAYLNSPNTQQEDVVGQETSQPLLLLATNPTSQERQDNVTVAGLAAEFIQQQILEQEEAQQKAGLAETLFSQIPGASQVVKAVDKLDDRRTEAQLQQLIDEYLAQRRTQSANSLSANTSDAMGLLSLLPGEIIDVSSAKLSNAQLADMLNANLDQAQMFRELLASKLAEQELARRNAVQAEASSLSEALGMYSQINDPGFAETLARLKSLNQELQDPEITLQVTFYDKAIQLSNKYQVALFNFKPFVDISSLSKVEADLDFWLEKLSNWGVQKLGNNTNLAEEITQLVDIETLDFSTVMRKVLFVPHSGAVYRSKGLSYFIADVDGDFLAVDGSVLKIEDISKDNMPLVRPISDGGYESYEAFQQVAADKSLELRKSRAKEEIAQAIEQKLNGIYASESLLNILISDGESSLITAITDDVYILQIVRDVDQTLFSQTEVNKIIADYINKWLSSHPTLGQLEQIFPDFNSQMINPSDKYLEDHLRTKHAYGNNIMRPLAFFKSGKEVVKEVELDNIIGSQQSKDPGADNWWDVLLHVDRIHSHVKTTLRLGFDVLSKGTGTSNIDLLDIGGGKYIVVGDGRTRTAIAKAFGIKTTQMTVRTQTVVGESFVTKENYDLLRERRNQGLWTGELYQRDGSYYVNVKSSVHPWVFLNGWETLKRDFNIRVNTRATSSNTTNSSMDLNNLTLTELKKIIAESEAIYNSRYINTVSQDLVSVRGHRQFVEDTLSYGRIEESRYDHVFFRRWASSELIQNLRGLKKSVINDLELIKAIDESIRTTESILGSYSGSRISISDNEQYLAKNLTSKLEFIENSLKKRKASALEILSSNYKQKFDNLLGQAGFMNFKSSWVDGKTYGQIEQKIAERQAVYRQLEQDFYALGEERKIQSERNLEEAGDDLRKIIDSLLEQEQKIGEKFFSDGATKRYDNDELLVGYKFETDYSGSYKSFLEIQRQAQEEEGQEEENQEEEGQEEEGQEETNQQQDDQDQEDPAQPTWLIKSAEEILRQLVNVGDVFKQHDAASGFMAMTSKSTFNFPEIFIDQLRGVISLAAEQIDNIILESDNLAFGEVSQEILLLRQYKNKGLDVFIALQPNFGRKDGALNSLADKVRLTLNQARSEWRQRVPVAMKAHEQEIFKALEITLYADLVKNPSLLDGKESKNEYFARIFMTSPEGQLFQMMLQNHFGFDQEALDTFIKERRSEFDQIAKDYKQEILAVQNNQKNTTRVREAIEIISSISQRTRGIKLMSWKVEDLENYYLYSPESVRSLLAAVFDLTDEESHIEESVKSQYRSLMRKIHPDLIPVDLKDVAEETSKGVNNSYDFLNELNKNKYQVTDRNGYSYLFEKEAIDSVLLFLKFLDYIEQNEFTLPQSRLDEIAAEEVLIQAQKERLLIGLDAIINSLKNSNAELILKSHDQSFDSVKRELDGFVKGKLSALGIKNDSFRNYPAFWNGFLYQVYLQAKQIEPVAQTTSTSSNFGEEIRPRSLADIQAWAAGLDSSSIEFTIYQNIRGSEAAKFKEARKAQLRRLADSVQVMDEAGLSNNDSSSQANDFFQFSSTRESILDLLAQYEIGEIDFRRFKEGLLGISTLRQMKLPIDILPTSNLEKSAVRPLKMSAIKTYLDKIKGTLKYNFYAQKIDSYRFGSVGFDRELLQEYLKKRMDELKTVGAIDEIVFSSSMSKNSKDSYLLEVNNMLAVFDYNDKNELVMVLAQYEVGLIKYNDFADKLLDFQMLLITPKYKQQYHARSSQQGTNFNGASTVNTKASFDLPEDDIEKLNNVELEQRIAAYERMGLRRNQNTRFDGKTGQPLDAHGILKAQLDKLREEYRERVAVEDFLMTKIAIQALSWLKHLRLVNNNSDYFQGISILTPQQRRSYFDSFISREDYGIDKADFEALSRYFTHDPSQAAQFIFNIFESSLKQNSFIDNDGNIVGENMGGSSFGSSCSNCSDVHDQAQAGVQQADLLMANVESKQKLALLNRQLAQSPDLEGGQDKANELEIEAQNLEREAEELKQQALAQIDRTRREVVESHGMQNQCVQFYLKTLVYTREAQIRQTSAYINKAIASAYDATLIANKLLKDQQMRIISKPGFLGIGKVSETIALTPEDLADVRQLSGQLQEGETQNLGVTPLNQMAEFGVKKSGSLDKKDVTAGVLYDLQQKAQQGWLQNIVDQVRIWGRSVETAWKWRFNDKSISTPELIDQPRLKTELAYRLNADRPITEAEINSARHKLEESPFFSEYFSEIYPRQQHSFHHFTIGEHTDRVVQGLAVKDGTVDLSAIAALLHDIGKVGRDQSIKLGLDSDYGAEPTHAKASVEIAIKILNQTDLSQENKDLVVYLIKYHEVIGNLAIYADNPNMTLDDYKNKFFGRVGETKEQILNRYRQEVVHAAPSLVALDMLLNLTKADIAAIQVNGQLLTPELRLKLDDAHRQLSIQYQQYLLDNDARQVNISAVDTEELDQKKQALLDQVPRVVKNISEMIVSAKYGQAPDISLYQHPIEQSVAQMFKTSFDGNSYLSATDAIKVASAINRSLLFYSKNEDLTLTEKVAKISFIQQASAIYATGKHPEANNYRGFHGTSGLALEQIVIDGALKSNAQIEVEDKKAVSGEHWARQDKVYFSISAIADHYARFYTMDLSTIEVIIQRAIDEGYSDPQSWFYHQFQSLISIRKALKGGKNHLSFPVVLQIDDQVPLVHDNNDFPESFFNGSKIDISSLISVLVPAKNLNQTHELITQNLSADQVAQIRIMPLEVLETYHQLGFQSNLHYSKNFVRQYNTSFMTLVGLFRARPVTNEVEKTINASMVRFGEEIAFPEKFETDLKTTATIDFIEQELEINIQKARIRQNKIITLDRLHLRGVFKLVSNLFDSNYWFQVRSKFSLITDIAKKHFLTSPYQILNQVDSQSFRRINPLADFEQTQTPFVLNDFNSYTLSDWGVAYSVNNYGADTSEVRIYSDIDQYNQDVLSAQALSQLGIGPTYHGLAKYSNDSQGDLFGYVVSEEVDHYSASKLDHVIINRQIIRSLLQLRQILKNSGYDLLQPEIIITHDHKIIVYRADSVFQSSSTQEFDQIISQAIDNIPYGFLKFLAKAEMALSRVSSWRFRFTSEKNQPIQDQPFSAEIGSENVVD